MTGAACARDAASRGFSVALIEQSDFASGTSSGSSKLIHGGLRYLEQFEFKLVFEALRERAWLLKYAPHLVRPLKFFLPVYRSDPRGPFILSLGLWLYDLLALFRAPGIHRRLKVDRLLEAMPGLKRQGIRAGFEYYDASMWDDVLVLENLRSAHQLGAVCVNYLKGRRAIWENGRVVGMETEDQETFEAGQVRAKSVIFCGGAWTDLLGERVVDGGHGEWKSWLKPSRGVHLVFDKKDFPVEGALLMTHPDDGRISFVMPRDDLGSGVVIVGTTDGPSPRDPAEVKAEREDRDYLLDLLKRYFPITAPKASQIISEYVGVRPLVGLGDEHGGSLSKVSREHHIDRGPGGSVFIAGGKYTTHRSMAEEIVDFAVRAWEEDYANDRAARVPPYRMPRTRESFNVTPIRRKSGPHEHRFGEDWSQVEKLQTEFGSFQSVSDPSGFPNLTGQFVYSLKYEMVNHLEDFVLRRAPLYLARQDHGEPWFEGLSQVWARVLNKSESERQAEITRLRARILKMEEGYR